MKAFKELSLKNSELIIIGGLSDGKDILSKYKGYYRYYPFMKHKELIKFYQNCDIFVLPSLLEGFAQVVIEAMACGTPVIVTDTTGSSDAVIDGKNGFIAP